MYICTFSYELEAFFSAWIRKIFCKKLESAEMSNSIVRTKFLVELKINH